VCTLAGEDCGQCGPKVTTEEDVKDVEIPEWKKKAISKGMTDASAAPFGMSWDKETSASVTDATKKL